MLHQIIKETGWTWHYVLWKVSRANILLMMADRSHISYKKKGTGAYDEPVKMDTGAGFAERLKNKKT